MAKELNEEELACLYAREPDVYETAATMHPYWRAFELDECDAAQIRLLESNEDPARPNFDKYLRLVSRITGIEQAKISGTSEFYSNLLLVIPPHNGRELLALQRRKAKERFTLIQGE